MVAFKISNVNVHVESNINRITDLFDKIRDYFLGWFMLLLHIKGRKYYEMERKEAFLIRTLTLSSWFLYQLRLSWFSFPFPFFFFPVVPEMLCSSSEPISVETM